MAATVKVYERNGGATPVDTDIETTALTYARFCTSDAVEPGTNYPCVKPAAGTNYSYAKWHRLWCTVTPTGTIDNVKWYTDGTITFGTTGLTVYAATTDTYSEPTGTEGTTGDLDAALGATPVDAATYTSGSPLSVTGSISNPSTGAISDYIVTQLAISTSAVAGQTPSTETFTFRYDET